MRRVFLTHRTTIPFSLIYLFFTLLTGIPASAEVGIRPAGDVRNDTVDWIKKVADWQFTQSTWDSGRDWHWGALHAGVMAAYEATKDDVYMDKCRQWAQKYTWRMASDSRHADNHACAQAYLELYLLDEQDPVRYAHSKYVNDIMVNDLRRFYCDVSTGSNVWWWCDALFMAPPVLARLSRILNDPSYTDMMHIMWKDTQDCLYDTEEHLFYRDINYFDMRIGGQKVFWSRGNGWVAAGLPRVLQYLPLDDPLRPRYETLLAEMASRLIQIQQPDGYWYSNLLYPERFDVPETSGTGFFCYMLAWGINNGYLDAATYWPSAANAWEALKGAVHPDGKLGWVQPVGVGPAMSYWDGTQVYGVGAYLLAGSEVQKYLQINSPSHIDHFEGYTGTAAMKTAWSDGEVNDTASLLSLGDYGDRFMVFHYANDQFPYRSEANHLFAAPKDFTADNAYYLSVLVRGNSANAAEPIYAYLEDADGESAVQVMTDPNVVQTAAWMELGFKLSGFSGIDLTQIRQLSIGVGLPEASAATGTGTIWIDRIRLNPKQCDAVLGDFDGDCIVNIKDLAVLAGQWQEEYAQTIIPVDPGTEHLIAYWPLDGNYTDATGNGYDASGIGDPTFTAGHIGQSVYFNGANYLACQDSADLTLNEGGTLSVWVKSSGLNHPWASVVTKGLQSWRLIRYDLSSAISFHFNSGSTEYQANGTTSVLDDQWHHLMAVYDGSTIRLYVDGKLDASSPAPGPVNVRTDPVYIGSRVDRPLERNWIGQIDDVRIYAAALSEVNMLYLAETGPVLQISQPRPADLVLDGTIDIEDLLEFVQSWLHAGEWPFVIL